MPVIQRALSEVRNAMVFEMPLFKKRTSKLFFAAGLSAAVSLSAPPRTARPLPFASAFPSVDRMCPMTALASSADFRYTRSNADFGRTQRLRSELPFLILVKTNLLSAQLWQAAQKLMWIRLSPMLRRTDSRCSPVHRSCKKFCGRRASREAPPEFALEDQGSRQSNDQK